MSLVRVGRCCVELHCGTVLGGGDLAHFPAVVTRMDTSTSSWTPYVYYTTLYSTPRYTKFRRIYWARNF